MSPLAEIELLALAVVKYSLEPSVISPVSKDILEVPSKLTPAIVRAV